MGLLARVWHDGLKNMAKDWSDFKQWIGDIGNEGLAAQMRAAADQLQRANDKLAEYQAAQEAGIAIS